MEKLEKIEQQLKEIENSLGQAKNEELKGLEIQVDKKIKELIGLKNYYQKQQNVDLMPLRQRLKDAKKLKSTIEKQLEDKKEWSKKENSKINKEKYVRPEEQKIKEILALEISREEKVRVLEKEIVKVDVHISKLQEEKNNLMQNKENKKESSTKNKKDRLEQKKQQIKGKEQGTKKEKKIQISHSSKNEQALNQRIKEIKTEIQYLKNVLQIYKTLLAQLKNKTKKSQINPNEKEIQINEEENKYYYLILMDLLQDDKNYFFIKRIVESNEKFINARLDNQPIIFELLDRYIKNLKLELRNQKLVHENPKFFYELLKLFKKSPDLELTKDEEEYFKSRIKELTDYLKNKGYSTGDKIKTELTSLEEEKPILKYILTKNYQEIMSTYAKNSKRANLTREYLEKVALEVEQFIENFGEQTYPLNWFIAKQLNINVSDIQNSEIIMDTIALENTKYAFSFGFNKNYDTYLRVHVVDTSILNGDFALKEMKEQSPYTSKMLSKKLKFKKGNTYPVITYQVKILENGQVENPKIFESKIKIDQVITNDQLIDYREDSYLKNFYKYTKFLAKFYEININKVDKEELEKAYDKILNFILKHYFDKNNLNAFYKTEIEFTSEEIYKLHYSICTYLSKLPKKESDTINRQLKNLKASCYFGSEALEESEIIIDTRSYLGYLNLAILKNSLHGLCNGTRYQEELKVFKECEQTLNQGEFFLDYRNQERLIRLAKITEINRKKAEQD